MQLLKKIEHSINIGDERSIRAKKNIIRMFVNKGFSLFLSFLNVPIFLNCLNDTRYGIWITIFSIVNWIGFLDIGLGQGLRNRLTETIALNNVKKAKELISTAYFALFIIFTSISVLVLSTSSIVNWSSFVNTPIDLVSDVNKTFIVVICLMCMTFILRVLDSVSLALQSTAITSDLLLASQFFSLVVVFIISKTIESPSLLTLGTAMAGVPILVYIVFTIFHFKHRFKTIAPSFSNINVKHIPDILSIGVVFFVIQLCGIILTQAGNVIITNMSKPENVPEFFIANKYFNILMMLFMIITTPYWSATTEAVIKKDYEWIKSSYRVLQKAFALAIIAGLLMLIVSPFVIRIWTHGRINVRFLLSILTLIFVLFYMLSNIFITFINGFGKIRMQLYLNLILTPLYIFLSVILCEKIGSIGVMLSSIIIYGLFSIWSAIQFKFLIYGTAFGIWNK